MWSAIICRVLINICLGMLLLVASCTANDARAQDTPREQRVNIAQAARLAETVSIEIIEEKMPKARRIGNRLTQIQGVPPRRVTIRNKQTIEQFVQPLNQELRLGVPPACIVQYVFRFHLSNDVIAEFGYMCEPVGPASFTWGELSDKSFRLGGWAILPAQFRMLVDAHLAMGAIQDIVAAERKFLSAAILDVNKNGAGEYGTLDQLQKAELIETLPYGYHFEVVLTGDPARDEGIFFVFGVPEAREPRVPPWWVPNFVWSQWVRWFPPFTGYTFASDQTGEIRRADLRDSRSRIREESRTWERLP